MNDLISLIRAIFGGVWSMFTEIDYPFLGVPVAAVVVGLLLVSLLIKLFRYVFGFSATTGTAVTVARAQPEKPKNKIGF